MPKTTPRITLRVLGTLRADVDGQPVTLGRRQQRVVLALLTHRANHVVAYSELDDWLWRAGDRPASARDVIQVHIVGLRRAFAAAGTAEAIQTANTGYKLQLGPNATDLAQFRQDVRAGMSLIHKGLVAQGAQRFRRALDQWQDEPYADLDHPAVRELAARISEERISALERCITADLQLGRHSELIAELRDIVSLHPLDETFRAHLMTALYRSGRSAHALNEYADARRHLIGVGLDPSPKLQALQSLILRNGDSAALQDLAVTHDPVIQNRRASDIVWGRPKAAPYRLLP